MLQKTYPDIAFWFCTPLNKTGCGSCLNFGISWGSVWKPCAIVQNTDKVTKAFPATSATKAIPVQCCACVFPLGDVAEEKTFSVTLERGNNAPPSCTALFPSSYPTTFSFYINSSLYGEIPAGQVMVGKMVPKWAYSPPAFFLFHQ